MPRIARIKSNNSKFHIMIRSIKEIQLFNNDSDKIKYFNLIKKYQIKYGFKVYAYCLMNNHGHLIIDCHGSDISKIMHGINFSYARYFNTKYKRYGPVFQDRFKSKVIDSDKYMLTLSQYIHNNPKDILDNKTTVENYSFSSLRHYINNTDDFHILDKKYLINLISSVYHQDKNSYVQLVKNSLNSYIEVDVEFYNCPTTYLSHSVSLSGKFSPGSIICYLSHLLEQNPRDVFKKSCSNSIKLRALSCLLMSCLCNMTQKEICSVLGNITQSGVSCLVSKGIDIISSENLLIVPHTS